MASDTFGSRITLKDRPATRRGILFIVRSVHDPSILQAKRLLQELSRKGLSSDDPVSDLTTEEHPKNLQGIFFTINEKVKNRLFH